MSSAEALSRALGIPGDQAILGISAVGTVPKDHPAGGSPQGGPLPSPMAAGNIREGDEDPVTGNLQGFIQDSADGTGESLVDLSGETADASQIGESCGRGNG